MKEFAIDVAAISTANGRSAFASQARGTLSERPLLTKSQPRQGIAEAAFAGALGALEDLSTFLSEGDCVDINFALIGSNIQKSIAVGSGNKTIDLQLKKLVNDLNRDGISVSLRAAEDSLKSLMMKAEMTLALAA